MLLLIFGRVTGIEAADAILHLTHLHDVMRVKISVDGIRQTAYQQIAAEQVHHMVMALLCQALPVLISLSQHGNGIRAKAVGNEKFLEIELEHILDDDAAHRDGSRVLKRDTQQTATGDISVAVVFTQELQHGEVLRVVLNLVKEHQCVVTVRQLVTGNHAEGQVKILLLMDVFEQLLSLVILHEVDLYVIRVQASTHLTDTERLAYLTGTFQYQDLVII